MQKFCFFIAFFLISHTVFCRDTLQFNEVIQKMNQLLDIKLEKPPRDFTPAWIDDVEIRTQTHDFELKQQEYNLRFTPVSVWIRAAQEAYYRSNIEMYEFDANKIKSDQLEQIYEDWIDLIFDKRELELSRELLSLFEDEEAVREKMISSSVESMDRYLAFREAKYNYEIEYESGLMKYMFRKRQLLEQLNFDTSLAISDELIEQDSISLLINSLSKKDIFDQSAKNKEIEISTNVIKNEIEIEEAENSQILDFLQFNYRGPHEDPMHERLSMTFAIRLPLAGSNKMKTQMLSVEKMELINEKKEAEQEFTIDFQKITSRLYMLFEQFRITHEHNVELREESKFLTQKMATLYDSPLWMLANKKSILKNQLKLLRIKKDIYNEYISLLSLIGYFKIEPEVNYLQYLPSVN